MLGFDATRVAAQVCDKLALYWHPHDLRDNAAHVDALASHVAGLWSRAAVSALPFNAVAHFLAMLVDVIQACFVALQQFLGFFATKQIERG